MNADTFVPKPDEHGNYRKWGMVDDEEKDDMMAVFQRRIMMMNVKNGRARSARGPAGETTHQEEGSCH
jgi:hypothetical protein